MHPAALYCQRAQLLDGQQVLEVGCGWGSLCLYVAARYPKSEVTAVSNSSTQKALIVQRAAERHLTNLKVQSPPGRRPKHTHTHARRAVPNPAASTPSVLLDSYAPTSFSLGWGAAA